MTEIQHQQLVIKWSQQPSIRDKYPELKLMYHIPNERHCTPAQGRQLKLAGVKSGVPDLELPVSRGGYTGLHIEMKTPDGRVSDTQKWWLSELQGQGRMCAVCYGYKQAIEILEGYLDGRFTRS